MSLVVNTNVPSINSQRQLAKNQMSLTRSLERLSSGLRINHSSDDAAGLAIATGMRAQSTGMDQATRNANDGLSVIQTADGAIVEQVEILQRIRVLSVQASSDLNSADNLKSIQAEINEQVAELTRIGNTTNFNGLALINGTFSNKSIQVGANAGESIDLSIGDYRATGMGGYAEFTGVAGGTTLAGELVTVGAMVGNLSLGTPGSLVTIDTTTTDGISSLFGDQSAIAKANAINAKTSQHGVTATVGATVLTGNAATVAAGSAAAGEYMEINGVRVVTGGDPSLGLTTTANDGTGALRALINAKSTQTGVVASLDATNKLVLTAADGRNVIVKTTTTTGNIFGFVGTAAVDGTTALAATANVGRKTGVLTLSSNKDFQVTANNPAQLGLTSGLYNADNTKTVAKIDVTATGGATSAIRRIDSALAKITNEQAKLGAMSNRFQHTISNLQISIENITASESRIRDTDFAVETANLTRAQIIQQAGTAMLSQANTLPQAALSLLGG